MIFLDFLKIVFGRKGYDVCKKVIQQQNLLEAHNFKKYLSQDNNHKHHWFITYSVSSGYTIRLRYESTDSRSFVTKQYSEKNIEFFIRLCKNDMNKLYISVYFSKDTSEKVPMCIEYYNYDFDIKIEDIQNLSNEEIFIKYEKFKPLLRYNVLNGISENKFKNDIFKPRN
ncbi:MAG: hypothetical protein [Caudoviricetes sp.]|nr:MAG: hypothetical protein [Caudoviricetes sp.]